MKVGTERRPRTLRLSRQRMWRNWQTRGVQVAVSLRSWRFESSHPHLEDQILASSRRVSERTRGITCLFSRFGRPVRETPAPRRRRGRRRMVKFRAPAKRANPPRPVGFRRRTRRAYLRRGPCGIWRSVSPLPGGSGNEASVRLPTATECGHRMAAVRVESRPASSTPWCSRTSSSSHARCHRHVSRKGGQQ